MAKKAEQTKDIKYLIKIGCNDSADNRFEPGEIITEADIKAADLKTLLEMGAVEPIKEGE